MSANCAYAFMYGILLRLNKHCLKQRLHSNCSWKLFLSVTNSNTCFAFRSSYLNGKNALKINIYF